MLSGDEILQLQQMSGAPIRSSDPLLYCWSGRRWVDQPGARRWSARRSLGARAAGRSVFDPGAKARALLDGRPHVNERVWPPCSNRCSATGWCSASPKRGVRFEIDRILK